MPKWIATIGWCAWLLTGCSEGGSESSQKAPTPWFETRAGDDTTVHGLSAEPVWTLSKDHESEEFVEVIGAVSLADSLIVLGDHRTGLLHFISRAGHSILRAGRRGAGPGEVFSLDAIGTADSSSVWLFDASNQRLVVRRASGEHRETKPFHLPAGMNAWPMVVGMLLDGDLVLIERHIPIPMGQVPGSILRDSTRLLKYSIANSSMKPLDIVPSADIYISPKGPARIYGAPYGPRLSVVTTTGRDGVLVGFSDSLRVSRLSAHGVLQVIVNRRFSPEPIPEGVRTARRTPRARGGSGGEVLPEAFIPRAFPAFGRIVADDRGGAWIQRYQMNEAHPPLWAVFTEEGVLRGLRILPARFHLLLVDGDGIVGVQRDDNGSEVVQRLRFR